MNKEDIELLCKIERFQSQASRPRLRRASLCSPVGDQHDASEPSAPPPDHALQEALERRT